MKQIFTILLLFASVIGSFAQHTISGIVTDEKNAPLPGVTVYVMSLAKGTVTDDNGKYELNNMPSGELQLQFSFVGRANVIRYTKLQKSDLQLNIVLNPSAIETEEVLVTSGYNNTQHENAVKIDVLKMQNNTNLISANLCESLAKIPGVDLITKGSGVAKPVIRGLSRDNILSLNNGMRFENFQYSDHHPLGIDEYDVENVEIIKGPASLLYGSDAVGGVLNFLKEKPASVGSFVADYNFKYLSVSQGISNNVGIKAAGSHFFGGLRAGFKSAADYLQGDGDFVPNSRMKEQAFHANAGYNNSWSSLKLFYDYNSEKLGLVEPEAVAETTERGREVGLMFEQITSNMVSSQKKIFVGDYTIEANASWQNAVLAHAQNNDLVELEMALRTLTYELKVHLPSGKNAEYIIGAQGISQQYSNINDRVTLLLPKASVDSYAAFALLQYTFFDKLNVQTGLRYDQKQIQTNSIGQLHEESFRAAISRDYGSLSGSVGATYQPSEQFLLRYNFAAAFRTPNLAELTANGPHEEVYEKGDASLIPQKALENDLSMHFHSANITFD
ncbi:MAG: hypothetical protein RIS47_2056, partial [Bacteroidota bacterium]